MPSKKNYSVIEKLDPRKIILYLDKIENLVLVIQYVKQNEKPIGILGAVSNLESNSNEDKEIGKFCLYIVCLIKLEFSVNLLNY